MTDPTIQKLIDKFERYPDVKYSHTDDTITFEPKDKNGFTVTLGVGPRDIIVSSDFWHEHFDKDEEDKALNCFAFMLSDSCRLRMTTKEKNQNAGQLSLGRMALGLVTPQRNFSVLISGHRHGPNIGRTT